MGLMGPVAGHVGCDICISGQAIQTLDPFQWGTVYRHQQWYGSTDNVCQPPRPLKKYQLEPFCISCFFHHTQKYKRYVKMLEFSFDKSSLMYILSELKSGL